jgi:hypothetical protein
MAVRLEKLDDVSRARLIPELRQRAEQIPLTDKRLQYVAYRGQDQVGFLSLDLHRCRDGILEVYDIWVVKNFRLKQVASDLVRETERIALKMACKEIWVYPHPLSDITEEDLLNLYLKRGSFHGLTIQSGYERL